MNTPVQSSLYLTASAFLYIATDVVLGETCMKAVVEERDKSESRDEDDHDFGTHRSKWRWINFECKTGCCGDVADEHCCEDRTSQLMKNTGIITGLSLGIFLLIATMVLITVCCVCYRSRRKQSQRRRRWRHRAASSTPSSNSLPPSYEMSVAMSGGSPGENGFCAEVNSPPSYDEVVSNSQGSQHSTTVNTQAPASDRVQVQGRSNPALSVSDERESREPTSVYTIS